MPISHLVKCLFQFSVVKENETQSYLTVGKTVPYIYIYTQRDFY